MQKMSWESNLSPEDQRYLGQVVKPTIDPLNPVVKIPVVNEDEAVASTEKGMYLFDLIPRVSFPITCIALLLLVSHILSDLNKSKPDKQGALGVVECQVVNPNHQTILLTNPEKFTDGYPDALVISHEVKFCDEENVGFEITLDPNVRVDSTVIDGFQIARFSPEKEYNLWKDVKYIELGASTTYDVADIDNRSGLQIREGVLLSSQQSTNTNGLIQLDQRFKIDLEQGPEGAVKVMLVIPRTISEAGITIELEPTDEARAESHKRERYQILDSNDYPYGLGVTFGNIILYQRSGIGLMSINILPDTNQENYGVVPEH